MPDDSINVRAAGYFLVEAPSACPVCRAANELAGFLMPRPHEIRVEQDALLEHTTGEHWESADCIALLFAVDYLAPSVERVLRQRGSALRAGASSEPPCWMNRCTACDYAWSDQDAFCEPGGAFLPTSAEEAQALRLTFIPERFEAAAAGYACDPQFFAALCPD